MITLVLPLVGITTITPPYPKVPLDQGYISENNQIWWTLPTQSFLISPSVYISRFKNTVISIRLNPVKWGNIRLISTVSSKTLLLKKVNSRMSKLGSDCFLSSLSLCPLCFHTPAYLRVYVRWCKQPCCRWKGLFAAVVASNRACDSEVV